jgi:pyruvate kinase
MKRTKIIATIGPATETKTKISQLKQAGANAYRINMSHGDINQWTSFIQKIRETRDDSPIFLDTRGPEVRLLGINGKVELAHGDTIQVSKEQHETLAYLSQPITLRKDMRVLLDDGNIEAVVQKTRKGISTLKITQPAVLTDRRKVSVPHTQDDLDILTKQDKEDLKACKKLNIDAYAISFTRSKKDVLAVRKLVGSDVMLIAKIENQEGVDHINEIIESADAIMVARGDLGVEIPLEDVPLVQKEIIEKCNRAAKPVIVATQMLSSMRNHNRPTRAEASDVANAIMDGSDCVMLSDETAMGEYPVETVQTMARIAEKMEPRLRNATSLRTEGIDTAEAISNSAYEMSRSLNADAIITATSSGFTARMVARHRPQTIIVGVAHDHLVKRQLQFTWGVSPIVFENKDHKGHKTIFEAVRSALKAKLITKSNTVIATAGVDTLKQGSTNLIEVHQVDDLLAYHKKH